jgi:hypothetical protein
LNINVGYIKENEIVMAITQLKNGKGGRIDNIPPGAIKSTDSLCILSSPSPKQDME